MSTEDTTTDVPGVALATVRVAAGLDAGEWPDERIRTVFKMAGGAAKTPTQLAAFLSTAQRYGLDPIMGEVWLAEMQGKLRVVVGRDAFVKIAQRDPDFLGYTSGVVRATDNFQVHRGHDGDTVTHEFQGFDRGPIVGSYCVVYHRVRRSILVVRRWDDLAHLHGKVVWKQNPEDMIETRAITAALRRMFTLSGIYSPADVDEPNAPAPVDPESEPEQTKAASIRSRMDSLRAKLAPPAPESSLEADEDGVVVEPEPERDDGVDRGHAEPGDEAQSDLALDAELATDE